MKMHAILLMAVFVLAGCNTVDAMKNNASRARVADGVKKDAKATGDAVERGAHEVGSAVGKALKHGGEKLEDASK
ncbi:MAG: hypothetical protein WC825_00735 [Gallionellaceae bacterium]|jgi:predicted small secreted protein